MIVSETYPHGLFRALLRRLLRCHTPSYLSLYGFHILMEHLAVVDLEVTSYVDPIDIALSGDENEVRVGILQHSTQA